MTKTKFRILYQNGIYTIEEGKPLFGFITIWRRKSFKSKFIKEAKEYLKLFEKGIK